MNSDRIVFYALKLSIANLLRLIFLLKILVVLSKKKKKGHEKEEVVGEAGFYLSKYKRREVGTSLLLIKFYFCYFSRTLQ